MWPFILIPLLITASNVDDGVYFPMPRQMTVFVNNPNPEGKPARYALDVYSDATAGGLSLAFSKLHAEKSKEPLCPYDLVFGGERLKAATPLADVGVGAEATLCAVKQLENWDGIQHLVDTVELEAVNGLIQRLRAKNGACNIYVFTTEIRSTFGGANAIKLYKTIVDEKATYHWCPHSESLGFSVDVGIDSLGRVDLKA